MKETVKNNKNKKEKRGSTTNTKIPSFLKKIVRVINYLDRNIKSKPLRLMICTHMVFITAIMYDVDIEVLIKILSSIKTLFFGL